MNNYELMYIHNITKAEIIDEFNKCLKELIEKLQGTIQEICLQKQLVKTKESMF